jgi:hypothetical protein
MGRDTAASTTPMTAENPGTSIAACAMHASVVIRIGRRRLQPGCGRIGSSGLWSNARAS